MFSAEKRRFCGGYGGGEGFGGFASVGSDLVGGMAEDGVNESSEREREREREEREEEWLQLSIGRQDLGLGKNNGSAASGLVELDLMPSSSSTTHSQMRPEFRPPRPAAPEFRGFSPSFFLQQYPSASNLGPQQEINWTFRPIPISSLAPPSPSPSQSYFARPFQLYDVAAAAGDFRVVQPPRRPHSGIWFMLQASHNQ